MIAFKDQQPTKEDFPIVAHNPNGPETLYYSKRTHIVCSRWQDGYWASVPKPADMESCVNQIRTNVTHLRKIIEAMHISKWHYEDAEKAIEQALSDILRAKT